MKTTQLYWLAGIVGIIGSVLNVIVELLPENLGQQLNLLVVVLLPWFLAAVYLRQRQASGTLGFIGYALHTAGVALITGLVYAQAFIFPALDPVRVQQLLAGTLGLLAAASLLILTVGIVAFGIAIFRAGVFPKWAGALYIVGSLLGAGAAFAPRPLGSLGEILISVSVIWLSLTLLAKANQAE